MVGRFIAGVGALVWSPKDDKYLLLKRAAHRDVAPNIWESVTGRLEQGEGYLEALQREVQEELSVSVQVDFFLSTMHFYRGEAIPENELVGMILCCSIDDPKSIKVSPEHSDHRWVTVAEAADLVPESAWVLEAVRRADFIRKNLSPELLDFFRRKGFDLTSKIKKPS